MTKAHTVSKIKCKVTETKIKVEKVNGKNTPITQLQYIERVNENHTME